MTGLMKVFLVVRESMLAGAIASKCANMLSKCCTRSFNWRGMRIARCFLNTAVAFKGKFNSILIFPTSNLDVA